VRALTEQHQIIREDEREQQRYSLIAKNEGWLCPNRKVKLTRIKRFPISNTNATTARYHEPTHKTLSMLASLLVTFFPYFLVVFGGLDGMLA
jgi:hypothetical protein